MTSHPAGAPDLRKSGAGMRAERVAPRIFQAADHPNLCAQTCAMIKLLLVVGVAGALTSSADAKIETFGVDRSSDEIGTPGRALHKSGKCCKRAAKLKRKKISYQMHWNDCEESLEESKSSASDCEKSLEESKAKEMPTCDYDSGEVFDGSSCIKAGSNEGGGGGCDGDGDGDDSGVADGGGEGGGGLGSGLTSDPSFFEPSFETALMHEDPSNTSPEA